VDYYFAMDTFNDTGVAKGTVVKEGLAKRK
jgi:hypothetical protein